MSLSGQQGSQTASSPQNMVGGLALNSITGAGHDFTLGLRTRELLLSQCWLLLLSRPETFLTHLFLTFSYALLVICWGWGWGAGLLRVPC